MAISEDEKNRFDKMADQLERRPELWIGICVGWWGQYGPDHHPIVVRKGNETIGEYDTLDSALALGARPWGSTPMCSSCAKISIK